MVKRLYTPVLISLEYPLTAYGEGDEFCPTVWVINDRPEPVVGSCLEITLETAGGTRLESFEQILDLAAGSAEKVDSLCWTLPAGAQWVRCRLHQGEELLSFNEYDLSVHDQGRRNLFHQLRSRLGDRLLGRD
jgi:hypothetical protein